MSPEHARSHAIDRRADVWSAGVVAWELFVGHRLHPKDEGVQTLLKVVSERPPLLGTVVKHIGPDVEGVIARALEPDINLRCPTVAVFARDLASAFGITGRLADHEEVAEYVRRVAGPKLEKRRAQIQEALRLRADGPAPVDVAPEEPHPVAAPEPETTVPSAPSLLSTRISMVEAAPRSDARGRSPPPGLETTSRKWQLGALSLAALAGVGVLVLTRGSRHPMDTTAGETVPVGTPQPAPPPAAEASFAASPRRIVQLHANARVDSLRVNTRSFSLTPPVADLEFERLVEDGDGPLTVVATSADGRRRSVTLAPGATSLNIDFLSFPPRPSLGTPVRTP
jgi:serine/threonine-protein kinase